MIHHRAEREAGAVEQYLEESLGLQVQALEKAVSMIGPRGCRPLKSARGRENFCS